MKKFAFFLTHLFCISVFAQFTITPNNSANALAQRIAGSGLTVFNASLNCGGGASGMFSYSGSDFGIPNGIILCTGNATKIANPGSVFCDSVNANNYADPSLTAIEATATNDVCILECDVIAMYANINITFIFGSEEYPEYVNSSFNDAFGFFLTGPNPAGGNYVSKNIGALPNGVPVSINNVNAGLYSYYFHDNYTNPNNDIVYDGYTIPITSVSPIFADSVYHMKIAIADASDGQYDSGIFIQDSLFISKPNTTGLTKLATGNIHLSPNPAKDILHITMPSGEATNVEVFNVGGNLVHTKFNALQNTVDVSNLENGVYMIRIKDKLGNVFSSKFVKE